MPSRRTMTARERAKDALEDALMEAQRAVSALEDALDDTALDEPSKPSTGEDATERLVIVAKSLLNEDGVYTRYDLALAIRTIEEAAHA